MGRDNEGKGLTWGRGADRTGGGDGTCLKKKKDWGEAKGRHWDSGEGWKERPGIFWMEAREGPRLQAVESKP